MRAAYDAVGAQSGHDDDLLHFPMHIHTQMTCRVPRAEALKRIPKNASKRRSFELLGSPRLQKTEVWRGGLRANIHGAETIFASPFSASFLATGHKKHYC
jgi:hypothetical protein